MRKRSKITGFRGPADPAVPGVESRRVILAELATIVGLTIATVIAATAVSVGIARASALDGVIDNDGGLFVIALVLGLVFAAIGGLSLLPGERRPRH
jgi:hypothetical protein